MRDKRYLLLIILLFIVGAETLLLRGSGQKLLKNANILNFPKEFCGYKGVDVALKSHIYDLLETKNVVMREYKKDDQNPILFYFIFSRQTAKTSDPPENCLIGDGMTVTNKNKINIALKNINLKVNLLLAEKQGQKYVYLYWFIAGKQFTTSYFEQRIKLLKAYLMRKPLPGGQVRVSIKVANNQEDSLQYLKEFIKDIMPFLLENIN